MAAITRVRIRMIIIKSLGNDFKKIVNLTENNHAQTPNSQTGPKVPFLVNPYLFFFCMLFFENSKIICRSTQCREPNTIRMVVDRFKILS